MPTDTPTMHTQQALAIRQAFETLKAKSILLRQEDYSLRKERLKALKNWVAGHMDDIREALYHDFKKPPEEVDLTEIYPILKEADNAIDNLRKWTKPTGVSAPLSLIGTSGKITYEPKGLCLIIAPWNFPFNLTIGPLVSAIAAGNAVIIKPSEMSPLTSALIERLVDECFESDVVAIFQGDKEVSSELLALPFDHIFFTGSPQVGKIVMEAASKHLTSVTLELGGKSPFIVDQKADLKDTAEKLVWGKYTNAGQTCIAPDYVLCQESVMPALAEHVRNTINDFFNEEGKGIEHSAAYARIINHKHYDRLAHMLENGLESGAQLIAGGQTDREDKYISPTVLAGLPGDSMLLQEEIFGPILPIVSYENIQEAIATINSKHKPLAMYIFCGDKICRDKLLSETSAGSVCLFETLVQFNHPNLPFGGVNHSGLGKSHGYHGFLAFSNQKPVLKQRVGHTSVKLLYPPYTPRVRKLIKLLLKYL